MKKALTTLCFLIVYCCLGATLAASPKLNQLNAAARKAALMLDYQQFSLLADSITQVLKRQENPVIARAQLTLNQGISLYFKGSEFAYQAIDKFIEVKKQTESLLEDSIAYATYLEASAFELWGLGKMANRLRFNESQYDSVDRLFLNYEAKSKAYGHATYLGIYELLGYYLCNYFGRNIANQPIESFNLVKAEQLMAQKSNVAVFFYAEVHTVLGNAAYVSNRMNHAISYWKLAIQKAQDLGCNAVIPTNYHNLAVAYEHLGLIDSSLFAMQRAFDIRTQQGRVSCGSLGSLIEILLRANDLKNTQPYIDLAKNWVKKGMAKFPIDSVALLKNIGNYYFQLGHCSKATDFYEKTLQINIDWEVDYVQSRAIHENLYSCYKQRRKLSQAIYHLEQYIKFDSIRFRVMTEQRILEMEKKYDNTQKEQEIALLKEQEAKQQAQIERQRIFNYSLLGGAVLLSALAFTFFRSRQKQKQANTLIAEYNMEVEAQNKKLTTLNQEKDALMNVVAHDLKSPLNNIVTLSELMASQTQEDERTRLLMGIRKESKRGESLVHNLLGIHLLEQNRQQFNWQLVPLVHLLVERIELFIPQAEEKGVTIQFEREALPSITTDVPAFTQIMDNLLSNAVKFSPTNTVITLQLFTAHNQAMIRVKDQGPGFTPEDRVELFQKFKKLSAEPTGNESSTGLGLAIVKHLVEKLGGQIELEQSRVGASFLLRFPSMPVTSC